MDNILKYMTKEKIKSLESMDLWEKAQVIASEAYKNIVDRCGQPYIEHLNFVADHLVKKTDKIVGLLHDLLEDTKITGDDLLQLGFSSSIVSSLELLNCHHFENYDDYIQNIIQSKDDTALLVKYYDMTNNMDKSRVYDELEENRLEKKYKHNYELLEKEIKRRNINL